MMYLYVSALFVCAAVAAWRNGSHIAYLSAGFIGIGELLYVLNNGPEPGAMFVLGCCGGLILTGLFRDRVKLEPR